MEAPANLLIGFSSNETTQNHGLFAGQRRIPAESQTTALDHSGFMIHKFVIFGEAPKVVAKLSW
jgi:hypothetical protein